MTGLQDLRDWHDFNNKTYQINQDKIVKIIGVSFMEFSNITEKIIGCAYRVYNTLGFGFVESVYEKALIIELKKIGFKTVSQEPITVYMKEKKSAILGLTLL